MTEKSPCGHPASLLVCSVESDYKFCELCEMRSQRNDAVQMEAENLARATKAEQALALRGEPGAKKFQITSVLRDFVYKDGTHTPTVIVSFNRDDWDSRDAFAESLYAAPISGEPLETAKRFHELYEQLAPEFGYETRPETRQFDPDSANGRLMIAVCAALQQEADKDEERLDWLENQYTLHKSAEFLYVVDGYEIMLTEQDGTITSSVYHGASLRAAIDAASAALPLAAQPEKQMNQTEALYLFCGWLTCRDKVTIMGASEDAAPIPPLIDEFCKKHGLPEVTEQYPNVGANAFQQEGEQIAALPERKKI